jgi:hypothetical protein
MGAYAELCDTLDGTAAEVGLDLVAGRLHLVLTDRAADRELRLPVGGAHPTVDATARVLVLSARLRHALRSEGVPLERRDGARARGRWPELA